MDTRKLVEELIKERGGVKQRYSKLTILLSDSYRGVIKLPKNDVRYIRKQMKYMNKYIDILNMRIGSLSILGGYYEY